MPEAVRLVIWDLDETFWKGTLDEGGIKEYVQAHHDVVVELARRGIVSSICSKNDADAVRAILQEKGIWEYSSFRASIGPRRRGGSKPLSKQFSFVRPPFFSSMITL